MTDREMLEFAAKAAGLVIDKSPYNGGGARNTGFDCNGNAVLDWHNGKSWNPLDDDGDAFRLAVKLGLGVSVPLGYKRTDVVAFSDSRISAVESHGSDPLAATRRAITRAAAEIGRNMK